MFTNAGVKIRKLTAIVLVILSLCMIMSAQAETVTADMLFGEVKDATYENAFLGLSCTMEGWHYYTDEEIEKINQMTKETLSEEIAELMNRNIAIMMAQSPDSTQNVNIQISNVKDYVDVYNTLGLQYVAENSLTSFKGVLDAAGYTDIQLEVGELTIGDQTFTCVNGEYKLQGRQLYFKQLWDLRDTYLVTVTATSVLEDTTDEIFSKFSLQ